MGTDRPDRDERKAEEHVMIGCHRSVVVAFVWDEGDRLAWASLFRLHLLMRNGAVNKPEGPRTPDQRRRPTQAPCLLLILKGLVDQRAGGREPSNEVVGSEITWGVAMVWILWNLVDLESGTA